MKIILLLVFVSSTLLMSCASHKSVEARVKGFMKDTLAPKFDDPASYQFASLRIDTFFGSGYIKNIRDLYKRGDTVLSSEETIERNLREADSLSALPHYNDSILDYQVIVSFRGKNKMGALVLDSISLFYYPVPDVVQVHSRPN